MLVFFSSRVELSSRKVGKYLSHIKIVEAYSGHPTTQTMYIDLHRSTDDLTTIEHFPVFAKKQNENVGTTCSECGRPVWGCGGENVVVCAVIPSPTSLCNL